MFSGVELYVNKLVTSNMDTNPYTAYLENLFSYGSDVKDNQLKAGEFRYEDEPTKFDDIGHTNVTARATPVAESKQFELQGRLLLNLVLQEKYLPNGVELRLRLNRASSQFSIMLEMPVVLKIDAAITFDSLCPIVASHSQRS